MLGNGRCQRARTRNGLNLALPILSRLVPNVGNRNKLSIARALVRAIAPMATRPHPTALRLMVHARQIGDAFAAQSHPYDRTGAPRHGFISAASTTGGSDITTRKYGLKPTQEAVEALPFTQLTLKLYGKEKLIRMRSVVALARFLKGTKVCAVWCEFYDLNKCCWSKTRLLLATELELTAEEILCAYAKRWSIEPLFHNLKRWWCVNNLWQQSRRVLGLWMQLHSM